MEHFRSTNCRKIHLKLMTILLLCLGGVSHGAAPSSAVGKIDYVAGGYDDGSMAFSLDIPTNNPAGCNRTQIYFVKNNGTSSAQDALAVAMFAKSLGLRVYVAIRGDECIHPDGTDIPNGATYPVAQRIVVID